MPSETASVASTGSDDGSDLLQRVLEQSDSSSGEEEPQGGRNRNPSNATRNISWPQRTVTPPRITLQNGQFFRFESTRVNIRRRNHHIIGRRRSSKEEVHVPEPAIRTISFSESFFLLLRSFIRGLFLSVYYSFMVFRDFTIGKTQILSSFKRYCILILYLRSDLLQRSRSDRDNERKTVNSMTLYEMPNSTYTFFRRLLLYDLYLPSFYTLIQLITNQLNSNHLPYKRISIIIQFMILIYSMPIDKLIFSLQLLLTPGSTKSFILCLILECFINFKSILSFWDLPGRSQESLYILIYSVILPHVYITSLDINKLEYEFLKRSIHTTFSPSTFVLYSYLYIIITLAFSCIVTSLMLGVPYITLVLFSNVITVTTLSAYIRNPLNYCIFYIFSLMILKYHTVIDGFLGIPLFSSTEFINPVLLCFKTSISTYGNGVRVVSFIRLMLLVIVGYISSIYKISKYNNINLR